MNPLIIGAAVLGIAAIFGAKAVGVSRGRLFDLKDIEPDKQGGKFKRDFDRSFERAANLTGVPFALLKAHAIAESSLNASAFRDESGNRADRKGWASRGLMQILWWPGSERWKKYGFPDSSLGRDGSVMFEPDVNTEIAARLIRDNLNQVKGNLRDAVNMYNTGKTEAQFKAPFNYVDKVLGYYNTILQGSEK